MGWGVIRRAILAWVSERNQYMFAYLGNDYDLVPVEGLKEGIWALMLQEHLPLLEVVWDWDPLHVWTCLVVAMCVGGDFQGLGLRVVLMA